MRILSLFIIVILLASCSKAKRSENAALKMREFVIELSEYAKSQDPGFLVIPQNGIELCFNYETISDGISTDYMNAIDGVGIEGLFYNYGTALEDGRIAQAEEIGLTKPVLVADYVNPNSNMVDAFLQSDNRGFIPFPRAADGYDYQFIPDSVHNENSNDINSLSNAQNFLYLISTSTYSSKAAFLSAIAASNFDLVLIDLFYGDEELTAADIQSLKTKANGGNRLVIAYMNIGAAETYRYYWQDKWKKGRPGWIKKEYDGYPDEYWVKFWKKDWKEIIYGNDQSYTKKLLNAGFDGAYLDNIEGYYHLYFDE